MRWTVSSATVQQQLPWSSIRHGQLTQTVATDREVYPTFDQLYDNMAVYAEESVKLVLSKQPTLNATQAQGRRRRGVQRGGQGAAAWDLAQGKSLRPRGRWGLTTTRAACRTRTAWARTGQMPPPRATPCSPSYQRYNDVELDWLHSETTAFLPSLYLQSTTNASQNLVYTKCMTAEAMRVARKWPSRFIPSPGTPTTRRPTCVSVRAGRSRRMGHAHPHGRRWADLVWGIGDCGNTTLCARLRVHVDGQLGPRVERLVRNADACSKANCSGNGRCVAEPTARRIASPLRGGALPANTAAAQRLASQAHNCGGSCPGQGSRGGWPHLNSMSSRVPLRGPSRVLSCSAS